MSRQGRQRETPGEDPRHREERRAEVARRKRPAEAPAAGGWWRSKWPIARPVLIFAGVMLVYYAIDFVSLPAFGRVGQFVGGAFKGYLEWIAWASAGILRLCGQQATALGDVISSPGFSVRIVRNCDALEPTAAFVAAVIASPVRFARKIPGLAIGVPSLLAINLLRVVSLFYIGVHHKEIFERVHYEIWQAVFIVLAVVFWAIWVQWATRRRTGQEP